MAQIGPVYVPQNAQPPETIPAIPAASVAPVRPMYAGFWLRVAAYLIDMLLMSPVFGLIMSFYPSAFFKIQDIKSITLATMPQPTGLGILFTLVLMASYFSLFEASGLQATPGKRIARIYVTDLNGQRLTIARAAARNFPKVAFSLAFVAVHLLVAFTEKKQGLHDILAGCLVLRRR